MHVHVLERVIELHLLWNSSACLWIRHWLWFLLFKARLNLLENLQFLPEDFSLIRDGLLHGLMVAKVPVRLLLRKDVELPRLSLSRRGFLLAFIVLEHPCQFLLGLLLHPRLFVNTVKV